MKRLGRMVDCIVLGAVAVGCARPSWAEVRVTHVGCPNISVASLSRSISFYTGVLDFKVAGMEDTSDTARLTPEAAPMTQARTAHLDLGDECLDVTQYESPQRKPFHSDSRANDRWFQHIAIVVSDMNAAYVRVRAAHVRSVSDVPQTLPQSNKEAAGIAAFYFRDPDGHYLELIHFPPGKGQAKWQVPTTKLFLGIDHTAIAVSDTERSLRFYRDELHFRVTGGSENYGNEQEHLSGVFNAHVLITSLRSESGIGIELLQYITPTTGRPIPANLHLEDIACWETTMDGSEIATPGNGHEEMHPVHWIKLPSPTNANREAAWVKDPDSHLLELIKP
jgi:catechol 2,3-dioxygenase-like lactoylglutathione lyase family enzyme